MKRFLAYLLILALFLTGCGIGVKQSNTISQNIISNSSSKTNESDIMWKWSFKDNHKTLENLQIFKSTDRGNSWTEINLPINILPKDAYSDVYVENVVPYFLDSNDGWISWINNSDTTLYVIKTTDGGKTWNKLSYKLPQQLSQSISKIQFVTQSTGWLLAVSDAAAEQQIKYLLKTNDGGKTWQKVNVTSSDSYSGLPIVGTSIDMKFYGTDNGWIGVSNPVSADVILYRTVDGGNTWSKVSVPTPQGYEKYCILSATVPVFKDDKNGTLDVDFYMANNVKSENHTVTYVTNDGGNTWSANVYAYDENKHIFVKLNTKSEIKKFDLTNYVIMKDYKITSVADVKSVSLSYGNKFIYVNFNLPEDTDSIIINANDGKFIKFGDRYGGATNGVWSPNHDELAFTSGTIGKGGVYLYDAENNVYKNFHVPYINVAKIFWNNDGDRIAFIGEKNSDFELCTIDLKDGKYSVVNKLNSEDIKSFSEKSVIWK
ncbi:YCF48-related protein [Thermoanaerobacterium sp. PSU-2]|uniref:YCF48-related protein n=1 Tax=Thermoanaerobacterium sp. PSU-2 TaxID=1930849 RepID=UPI001F0AC627|nr:YCF48-related protein [Thermoanaerobacterium sp. PSU-2]